MTIRLCLETFCFRKSSKNISLVCVCRRTEAKRFPAQEQQVNNFSTESFHAICPSPHRPFYNFVSLLRFKVVDSFVPDISIYLRGKGGGKEKPALSRSTVLELSPLVALRGRARE